MTARMRAKMMIGCAATILAASIAALHAQPTPTTAPATSPAAAAAPQPAGDWFSGAATTTPAEQQQLSEAQRFARLYPRLARADKATRDVTPRLLFDAIEARGEPPLKLVPMHGAFTLFTDASSRAYGLSKPPDPWLQVPDERRARIAAVEARQRGASLFLDIETLPLDVRRDKPADIDRSVRMIAKVAGWTRAQDPNLRLFMYAGFPINENYLGGNRAKASTRRPGYDWWKQQAATFEPLQKSWAIANDHLGPQPDAESGERVAALSELFDGTCPSLYLYNDPELLDVHEAIPGFVRSMVNEARRYGKPVYPFVWYLLCDKPVPVPLPQWTTLMREVMTHADGAVLWDTSLNTWNNRGALRVRIAMLLAERKGAMTDLEIYEAIKADFPGDSEINVLRGDAGTTQPTTQPAR